MYDLSILQQGLAIAFTPQNLLWLFLGLLMGLVVGIIPGFSEGTYLAIILPFTLYMDPWSALIFMTAIYMGAESGGEYPSILLNLPGTVGTFASAFEGYPLTRRGLPGQALGCSIAASTAGGILGGLAFMFVGPLIGVYAAKFQSPELFMVAVFGLTAVASVTGESVLKGLTSAVMGLLLATTGADLIVGTSRASFGFHELDEGIPLLPALIGLFGFAELLRQTGGREGAATFVNYPRFLAPLQGMREALRYPGALVRSTLIGLLIGIIPGVGAATATVVSYGQAKKWSKHPEQFGTGSFEGLLSTDSSNNACVPGTLIPTLALGMPGSGSTAVMLAALMLHGLRPGPGFWEKYAAEAYALGFASISSTILMLVLCFFIAKTLIRIAFLPTRLLAPLIAVMCIVGVYTHRAMLFDVGLMVVFGLVGLLLQAHRYSIPALLLGLILGPMAEENFFRSLELGGPMIFLAKPLSAALLTISAGLLLWPVAQSWRQNRSEQQLTRS